MERNKEGIGKEKARLFHFFIFFHFSTVSYPDVSV